MLTGGQRGQEGRSLIVAFLDQDVRSLRRQYPPLWRRLHCDCEVCRIRISFHSEYQRYLMAQSLNLARDLYKNLPVQFQ